MEVSHYRVNVNRFRARLTVFCITEKLLADVKCDGWPDVSLSLDLVLILCHVIVLAVAVLVTGLKIQQYWHRKGNSKNNDLG